MLVLGLRTNESGLDYNYGSRALRDQVDWLRAHSATARHIIEVVEDEPDVTVNIVVADREGVFGTSNTDFRFDLPVIIWSPFLASRVNAANITGTRASGAAMFDKKVETEFPPAITLIHELGHAKQFIEHPDWFPTTAGPGTQSNAFLEADNLARHEQPVCRELGIRQRVRYDDLIGLRTVPFG